MDVTLRHLLGPVGCVLFLIGCDEHLPATQVDQYPEEEVTEERPPEVDWTGCAEWTYDATGNTLTAYPDDALTRVDPSSRTGLRLQLSDRAWLEGQSNFVQRIASDLDQLDGWGINAGILLEFTGTSLSTLGDVIAPLPSEARNGTAMGARHFAMVYMENKEDEVLPHFPSQVPVELRFINEGKGLIFEPLKPLKPTTRYGLVLSAIEPNSSRASCIAPSDKLDQLLDEDQFPELAPRRAKLLNRAGLSPEDVAAFTVFTTQSVVDVASEIATFIKQQPYRWNDDLACEREGADNHCTRSFNALHFQDDQGRITDATPKGEYALVVHVWRPRNRADETPSLLFGHGIGGDISNIYFLDGLVDQLPVTRIAMDAVAHGEHPLATKDQAFERVLDFFALDLSTQTIDALKARDNFRQSTYDKLQLIELLHQDSDINQDGREDLDLSRMAYYGLSLGGIMGVEFLALEPRIDLTILAVSGARLVSVLTDGSVIGDFKPAIYALVGGEEEFHRFTPLAQVLLDAADPGSFAPYLSSTQRGDVLGETQAGDLPHLLMQVAMNDEVVPNNANYALARALEVPQVGERIEVIPLLSHVSAPLSGTVGQQVRGVFQFDRVTTGPHTLSPSDHINVPKGREGLYQARVFIEEWLSHDQPKIVDPYARFGIPPLETE